MQTQIFPEHELLQRSHQEIALQAQAGDLAAALRKRLTGEVRFDAGSRSLYAGDLSIYSPAPIGVVIPRTRDEVIATVDECRQRNIPILTNFQRPAEQFASSSRAEDSQFPGCADDLEQAVEHNSSIKNSRQT